MSGKRTTSRYANATLVLLLASCVLLAQTTKSGPPSVTKTSPAPTVEKSRSEADVLREHQLRVLRETLLTRTVDNIKKMDEAGLRISARNQLLAYLSSEKPPSDARQTVATQIARDALHRSARTQRRDQSFHAWLLIQRFRKLDSKERADPHPRVRENDPINGKRRRVSTHSFALRTGRWRESRREADQTRTDRRRSSKRPELLARRVDQTQLERV